MHSHWRCQAQAGICAQGLGYTRADGFRRAVEAVGCVQPLGPGLGLLELGGHLFPHLEPSAGWKSLVYPQVLHHKTEVTNPWHILDAL